MMAFGLIGYFMRKIDIPTAPAILGLLLGPMAESGLMNSIVMAKGNVVAYYLGRPSCVVLIILTLLAILGPIIQKGLKYLKKSKKSKIAS